MNDHQRLIDQLILHEGIRLMPYVDTVGKVTIGIGRNLTDNGISRREAIDLLDHDLEDVLLDFATAFPWFAALDPVRQRVLIDMRFNLGPAKFRSFARTIALVVEGSYGPAADAMLHSVWAEQVKGRADRLARMMRTGTDYTEVQA